MAKKARGGASEASRREALRRQQQLEAEQRRRRLLRLVGVLVGALVLGAIAVAVWLGSRGDEPAPVTAAGTPPNANADRTGIVVNPGKGEGKPLVALYADYQCAHCKNFEAQYGPMLASLADKGEIRLESRTMTFMQVKVGNTASERAAVAAACADRAGAYWAYQAEVFANQPQITRGIEGYSDQQLREEIPAKVGITGDKLTELQRCYDERATEAFVKQVDDAAAKAEVPGTPALTVNGKLLDFETVDLGSTEEELLKVITEHA